MVMQDGFIRFQARGSGKFASRIFELSGFLISQAENVVRFPRRLALYVRGEGVDRQTDRNYG
jgi:hypothetical protein